MQGCSKTVDDDFCLFYDQVKSFGLKISSIPIRRKFIKGLWLNVDCRNKLFFHWSIKTIALLNIILLSNDGKTFLIGVSCFQQKILLLFFFSPLFPTLPYSPLLFCDRFCLHGMVFQLCLIIIWTLSEILLLKTSFLVFIKNFF